jgi:predicted dehydrogenase
MKKKRYAQVGIGGRAAFYYMALGKQYRDQADLVALCDPNRLRMQFALKNMGRREGDISVYTPNEFEQMMRKHEPDVLIVTTVDRYHAEYIIRGMELGCDVITEKPLAINATQCQQILDTVKKTRRDLRVTFNYRYSPVRAQVKKLLMDGIIGDILSVDFHWMLDTSHGADYFRRWHRQKENSGGLMVHKASHHFDLVNWWLGSHPEIIHAMGKRGYYLEEQARRLGLQDYGERCLECTHTKTCPFYLDLTANESLRSLYLDTEQEDGYFRDRCVFSNQITIEDSMNLIVQYNNQVMMSYSLNAFTPYEGYRIIFNGNQGRLEHDCRESVYISGDGTVPGQFQTGTRIQVFPHFDNPYELDIWKSEGGHGGGDDLLLNDILTPKAEDPLNRKATVYDGAYAILTGIAANHAFETNQPVFIQNLVKF